MEREGESLCVLDVRSLLLDTVGFCGEVEVPAHQKARWRLTEETCPWGACPQCSPPSTVSWVLILLSACLNQSLFPVWKEPFSNLQEERDSYTSNPEAAFTTQWKRCLFQTNDCLNLWDMHLGFQRPLDMHLGFFLWCIERKTPDLYHKKVIDCTVMRCGGWFRLQWPTCMLYFR